LLLSFPKNATFSITNKICNTVTSALIHRRRKRGKEEESRNKNEKDVCDKELNRIRTEIVNNFFS